tara:strand:+ start:42117 stop:42305 length:189 start_codon:yes stop_codon:yes gene_type:complete
MILNVFYFHKQWAKIMPNYYMVDKQMFIRYKEYFLFLIYRNFSNNGIIIIYFKRNPKKDGTE